MSYYLEQLFTKYGTDKGIWGYTPAYEKHLAGTRLRVERVLEVGICGFRDIPNNVVGASLFAWRDYFPSAMIYGLDNDNRFIFNDQGNIRTALADAYDATSLTKALMSFHLDGAFDFICDDAVHDPLPQIRLMQLLWPLLKRGGVYAIEESCPYKCPGNSLVPMVSILQNLFPGQVTVDEYQTHKDERLLILTKA
jgi:hypothetical protein